MKKPWVEPTLCALTRTEIRPQRAPQDLSAEDRRRHTRRSPRLERRRGEQTQQEIMASRS